jgi:16S rRNA (guanine966-N2)-methyltransferase
MSGSLRIIGGRWRSRKIKFAIEDAVRPSPDRVRETLFNWLSLDIAGASCLELFAGSGALSIEALSRGAQDVVIVDSSAQVLRQIKSNLDTLEADSKLWHCVRSDAIAWLAAQTGQAWDIIFLDPPFSSDYLSKCLQIIDEQKLLKSKGFIYFESANPLTKGDLGEGSEQHWLVYRQKKSGAVHYGLICQP